MTNKEYALQYALKKWPVFPVYPIVDGKCSCNKKDCRTPGKHPLWHKDDLLHGHNSATTDLKQVETWWDRWPNANIGMPTGKRSGIVVLDIESRDNGFENAQKIVSKDKIMGTFVNQSGGGGIHAFYTYNEIIVKKIKVLPGVDILGDGIYVLLPPSNHISGNSYFNINDNVIAPLPQSLVNYNKEDKKSPINQKDWEKTLYEGERDAFLTRLAGKLARANLPKTQILEILQGHDLKRCSPSLGTKIIEKIVNSIYETHQRNYSETTVNVNFKVLNFEEFVDEFWDKSIEWQIKDWLPVATTGIIGGDPGTRKTFALIDLATAIITKRKFLNKFDVLRTGKVLFVNQEDFPAILLQRMALTFNPGKPTLNNGLLKLKHLPYDLLTQKFFTHVDQELKLNNIKSIEALEKSLIKNNFGWGDIVIIDPLYSIASADDYMMKAANDLLVLKKMRNDYGCTFLLAHHLGKTKADGKRARDSLWGSIFINAWLETGIEFERTDYDNIINAHRHFKMLGAVNPYQINFNINPFSYDIKVKELIEPKKHINIHTKQKDLFTTKYTDDEIKVMRFINESTSKSIAEISRKTAVSKTIINNIIELFEVTKKQGYYQFPIDITPIILEDVLDDEIEDEEEKENESLIEEYFS